MFKFIYVPVEINMSDLVGLCHELDGLLSRDRFTVIQTDSVAGIARPHTWCTFWSSIIALPWPLSET